MNSCQPIRNDLAACLMQTDCVQKDGKTGQECLRDHLAELPSDCQLIYKSYVSCRRGLLDMRKRFRGNAPTASRENNPPGGTTIIDSSVSVDAASSRPLDPSSGLGPDQSDI
ncbi:hypothetical protein CBS101457_001250 [Exobasidium rhododendri]|nr:hypothetical protein CBS101457_001250 [Exobasidium rhododendri]